MNILHRIVETKRQELTGYPTDPEYWRERVASAPPARDFHGALADPGNRVSLIAEVKRRSPGAGPIRPDLTPGQMARAYARGGAAALSVLTDRDYFQGSLEDLVEARAASGLPVLRKDFTIDPRQIQEARAHGADAVLLIVRLLSDEQLRDFRELAEALGMAALVETHTSEEVDRALASGSRIVGINNRDLRTFETRLQITLDLMDRIPGDVVCVSESGIRTPSDVTVLGGAGVDAILVGESLLRAEDPGVAAEALSGRVREPRS